MSVLARAYTGSCRLRREGDGGVFIGVPGGKGGGGVSQIIHVSAYYTHMVP